MTTGSNSVKVKLHIKIKVKYIHVQIEKVMCYVELVHGFCFYGSASGRAFGSIYHNNCKEQFLLVSGNIAHAQGAWHNYENVQHNPLVDRCTHQCAFSHGLTSWFHSQITDCIDYTQRFPTHDLWHAYQMLYVSEILYGTIHMSKSCPHAGLSDS